MLPVVQGHIPTTVGGGNRTILALDVLTEKLRDQTLEESSNQNKSQIKFIHPGDGYKLSKNTEAKIANAGKKVFTVQLNTSAGKNLISEISSKLEDNAKTFHIPDGKFSHPCETCDNFPSMTVDPPKKRHCRSLTLPLDRPAPTNWQPQESHVWKPITVITKNDCRGTTTQTSFSSSFYAREHLLNGDTLSCESAKTACLVPRTVNFEAGGLNIPCDIFTPPESPVPRPSSASTCSRRGDGIFSPLNAPWLDQPKYHAFDFRSLSCEDQISCSATAGSTPSVHVNSHHSSPHRHRIPRCRSQPSVLHDRKYGVKRRRDYDHRPALNFLKMTETAYQGSRSQPLSTPGCKEKRVSRFHEELASVMSLMPIASSPLDNDIPLKKAMESRTSPIHESSSGCSDSAKFLDGELSEFITDDPVHLIGEDTNANEMEEIFSLQDELDLEQIETN